MSVNQQKMDGPMWLAREITQLDPTKYWVEYPAKKAREVFPVDTSVGKGFKKYTYKQYNKTGQAKIMNSKATDIPKLNVFADEFTANVFDMAIGQDFSQQDLDVAARTGDNLDGDFIMVAREAHIYKENDVAFYGDSASGLDGLTVNANIGNTVAINGALGSPLWTGASAKTAAEVYFDVADMIDSVNVETKGTHIANAVMFPLSARPQLNAVYNTLNGDSVLTVLKKNFPEVSQWEFVNELETAGTGSTRVMYAYDKNPLVLRMIVPFETEVLAPVAKESMGYVVNSRMGIGGLNIRKPLAIQGVYGI